MAKRTNADSMELSVFFPENLLKLHNKFTCSYCFQTFKNFEVLKCHLNNCKKPPKCKICQDDISFRSQNDLIDHLKDIHFIDKPFDCQLCSKKFKLKSSLQKHFVLSHKETDKTPLSFQCDLCPKKFIKKIYLTNHKCNFHNLAKNYMCSVCGKQFLTEASLKSHLSNIHQNPMEFKCQNCPKIFKRKDKVSMYVDHFIKHKASNSEKWCSYAS